MYIIVTEKYFAVTIVLNTIIIITVYKSIAINYYLLKVENTIAIHSDSEVLIFYFILNFVFGSL